VGKRNICRKTTSLGTASNLNTLKLPRDQLGNFAVQRMVTGNLKRVLRLVIQNITHMFQNRTPFVLILIAVKVQHLEITCPIIITHPTMLWRVSHNTHVKHTRYWSRGGWTSGYSRRKVTRRIPLRLRAVDTPLTRSTSTRKVETRWITLACDRLNGRQQTVTLSIWVFLTHTSSLTGNLIMSMVSRTSGCD